MQGRNEVYLSGYIKFPEVQTTRNGYTLFKGKVEVPTVFTDKNGEVKEIKKYIQVSAWGDLAQELGELQDGTPVHLVGSYNQRSYEGNCKSCSEPEKKYWTDVLVDNFEVAE